VSTGDAVQTVLLALILLTLLLGSEFMLYALLVVLAVVLVAVSAFGLLILISRAKKD
jgi:hypothetical protein